MLILNINNGKTTTTSDINNLEYFTGHI